MRRNQKTKRTDPPAVSPYKLMWVMLMFDLPVATKPQRKEYTLFRKRLIKRGFQQLQYSVYARPCPSDESAQVHKERIQRHIPVEGEVRIIMLTDKQFSRMECFFGKKTVEPEPMPAQLSFF